MGPTRLGCVIESGLELPLLGLGAGLVRPLPLRVWLRSIVPGVLIAPSPRWVPPSCAGLRCCWLRCSSCAHVLGGALVWPARMVFPCLVAGLLFGHTYSARVWLALLRTILGSSVWRLLGRSFGLPREGRAACAGSERRPALWRDPDDAPERRSPRRLGALKPDWRSDGFQLAGTLRSSSTQRALIRLCLGDPCRPRL